MATAVAVKMRCWEFKKCGCEKDRSCPAVTYTEGRACWLVPGTRHDCGTGSPPDKKILSCMKCDFYLSARGELF